MNLKYAMIFAVVVVHTLVASMASAQHPFVLTRISGTHSFTSVTLNGLGEWNVSIASTGGPSGVAVLSVNAASVKVNSINVTCSGTIVMVINETSGGTFDYIRSISSSLVGSSELQIGVAATGDLGNSGGTIAAGVVGTIQIGGDLVADVISGPRPGGATSTITSIVVSGNITGDITNNHGPILDIAVGGDIGSSGSEVAINARDGIDEIIADAIYADINAQANSGSGSLHRLETTVGNFEGSLSTEFLIEKGGVSNPGIFVAGDIEAPIAVDQDIRQPIEVDGDLDANITVTDQVRSRIVIGGSLVSGRTISAQALTEAGIIGQVIINANNASGTWAGSVVVNGNTLATAPYDSNTALGGAVGLAPFRLHGLDCVPVDGGSVSTSDDSVALRFYGPVKWTSGRPFSVEVCTGTCSEDVDVSNEFAATGNGTREITLTRTVGNFPANTVWHVRPVTLGASALKCANLLTASDVLVTTFTYDFGTP